MRAYRTARPVECNCDVENCTAQHFEHGAFGELYFAPYVPPNPQSFGSGKSVPIEYAPIPYVVNGNVISFPGRLLKPILLRAGKREVTEVVTSSRDKGHYSLRWQCDCGRVGRMMVGDWRRNPGEQCEACAKPKKAVTYSVAGAVTLRDRIAADAQRRRRNPLSAVNGRATVIGLKIAAGRSG